MICCEYRAYTMGKISNKMRRVVLGLVSVFVCVGVFVWWQGQRMRVLHEKSEETKRETETPQEIESSRIYTEGINIGTEKQLSVSRLKKVSPVVPFTPQAPMGKWSDSVFQNGCEEASVLMVSRIGNDGVIDTREATENIIALSKLSKQLFGTTVDTSTKDTLTLYRHFTGREEAGMVLDPVTDEALQSALAEGGILIVPMNGRALGNPHFTAPGPETHMLVVTGYDAKTKEYITQDPGTRYGSGYRYGVKRFFRLYVTIQRGTIFLFCRWKNG